MYPNEKNIHMSISMKRIIILHASEYFEDCYVIKIYIHYHYITLHVGKFPYAR